MDKLRVVEIRLESLDCSRCLLKMVVVWVAAEILQVQVESLDVAGTTVRLQTFIVGKPVVPETVVNLKKRYIKVKVIQAVFTLGIINGLTTLCRRGCKGPVNGEFLNKRPFLSNQSRRLAPAVTND